MVLAQRVGTKRSFGLGLTLTIVTFGIYAIYWNYRAHNELYRQFELQREGRDEGMVWYVLGLTLTPLLIAYLWIFASNVQYVRDRIGLARAMTPGRFILLTGAGAASFAAASIAIVVATWGLDPEAAPEQVSAAVDSVAGLVLALAAAAAVLIAIGYHGLQRDVNELWDAFEARALYLSMHPEALAERPAYMADLQPATPRSMASPLRAEIERLRARHADLRAYEELDRLVARAESGDHAARENGERLLADLAGVLHERADLLRIREERLREGKEIEERIRAGTIFEEDLRRRLAEITTGDLDERLQVLETALFRR